MDVNVLMQPIRESKLNASFVDVYKQCSSCLIKWLPLCAKIRVWLDIQQPEPIQSVIDIALLHDAHNLLECYRKFIGVDPKWKKTLELVVSIQETLQRMDDKAFRDCFSQLESVNEIERVFKEADRVFSARVYSSK